MFIDCCNFSSLALLLWQSCRTSQNRSIQDTLNFSFPYWQGWARASSLFSSPWSSSGTRRCPCVPPKSFRPFPQTLPQPGGLQLLSGLVGHWDCSSSREEPTFEKQEGRTSSCDSDQNTIEVAACRVSYLAEFMLSLQPRLKGRFHLGQLFKLLWKHTEWTPPIHQWGYLLHVCIRTQHAHCTLYSISCLFSSSWGSIWRFFSVCDTSHKSFESSTQFLTSLFGSQLRVP